LSQICKLKAFLPFKYDVKYVTPPAEETYSWQCHPIGALYWQHCLTHGFTESVKCSQEKYIIFEYIIWYQFEINKPFLQINK